MKAIYSNNTALGPGNGFIAVDDLSPLPNLEGLRFSLKRGSDHNNLGPGGWQGAESALQPESVTLTDTGIALAVGKTVVDNLEPHESYRLTLVTADGMNPIGRLEVPEVAYSLQGAEQGSLAGEQTPESEPVPEPVQEPEPEPEAAPEAAPEPEPELSVPEPPAAKKGLSPLVVLLVLAALGIAAFIGWKLYSDAKESETTPPPVSEPGNGSAAQAGEPADAPKELKSALAQARAHLAGSAAPEQSLVLAKALHVLRDGADAAFLLAEDAAEKGNAEAMLLAGSFYDPVDAAPSGSIIKDPAQALAWYKKAGNAGHADAEARLAALKQWVEAEAAKGNPDAKLLLDSM